MGSPALSPAPARVSGRPRSYGAVASAPQPGPAAAEAPAHQLWVRPWGRRSRIPPPSEAQATGPRGSEPRRWCRRTLTAQQSLTPYPGPGAEGLAWGRGGGRAGGSRAGDSTPEPQLPPLRKGSGQAQQEMPHRPGAQGDPPVCPLGGPLTPRGPRGRAGMGGGRGHRSGGGRVLGGNSSSYAATSAPSPSARGGIRRVWLRDPAGASVAPKLRPQGGRGTGAGGAGAGGTRPVSAFIDRIEFGKELPGPSAPRPSRT